MLGFLELLLCRFLLRCQDNTDRGWGVWYPPASQSQTVVGHATWVPGAQVLQEQRVLFTTGAFLQHHFEKDPPLPPHSLSLTYLFNVCA